jgi:hypothetical protein
LAPIGVSESGEPTNRTSRLGDVGVDGDEVVPERRVRDAARVSVVTVSSSSAWPIPPTVPPMIWLRASFS